MKYLIRNKVYEKVPVLKDAKKIYIFCEGQKTEIKYFNFFQGLSSNIDIIAIPNEDGKSDPKKLMERAEVLFVGNETTCPKFNLSEGYNDEVWFVIDTDDWNSGNKIQQLRDFCANMNQQENHWFVAQSNPSFEQWQYYHFFENKPDKGIVDGFSSFKEFVNNSIRGGFDSSVMPILINDAIRNSVYNFEVNDNQPMLFSTEIHLLAQVIVALSKDQLEKVKEMLIRRL